MFCREQVARLAEQADAFFAIPARVVVIGSGSPVQARRFAEEYPTPFTLLTDPSRRTYEAIGFVRGWQHTLGSVATYTHSWRAMRDGFRQGATQGDPWQLGGALVIRPSADGGVLAYAFEGQVAGHHPEPALLVAAAREAALTG